MKRILPLFLPLMFLALAAALQDKDQPANPDVPTITFDVYWEAATPQAYNISVDSSGKAKYSSRNLVKTKENNEDPEGSGFELEFTMSGAARDRLFQWAQEMNYFNGNFDYTKHRVADTGRKILTYADSTRHFQTTYNWSENRTIDQVTRLFTGISSTIEHGRRLQFKLRFDKLGLEAELKGMEDMAQKDELAELQIIAPTLQRIADDFSVLNLARQRARRLLESIPK